MNGMIPASHYLGRITSLEGLVPGPDTNAVFGDLVRDTLAERIVDDLTPDRRAAFCEHCAKAECALERAWAERIAASKDPHTELRQFPYVDNYERLAAWEYASILQIARRAPRKILFVGSGPLPLSAWFLSRFPDVRMTVLDRDTDALTLGKAALLALGAGETITHIHADAEQFDGYAAFDTIIIAALVGETDSDLRSIFDRLAAHVTPSADVIARSVHGTRSLLYRPVPQDVHPAFVATHDIRPPSPIINSLLCFRTASSN